jgi:O-antigen/teichoic acid export membrane protein
MSTAKLRRSLRRVGGSVIRGRIIPADALLSPKERRIPMTTQSGAGIARNTGAAMAAQMVTALSGFALLYVAGVVVGPAGVGDLGVALAISYIGQALAALGMDAQLTRIVAKDPARSDEALADALLVAAPSATLTAMIVFAIGTSGVIGALDVLVAVVGIAIIPGTVAVVCEAFFAGRERIDLTTTSNTLEAVVRLATAAILLVAGWGVAAIVVAIVASRSFAALFDLWLVRAKLGTTLRFGHIFGTTRALLTALPLFGVFVLGAIFFRSDYVAVAALAGEAQAGLFVAAYRPVEVAGILPASLLPALYPVLSRQMEASATLAVESFERSVAIVGAIMVGGAVMLSLEAPLVVRILYPAGFDGAAPVLAIVSLSLIPLTLDTASAAFVLAQGRYRLALFTVGFGAATLLVLNAVLDPIYGAQGAAVSRLIAVTALSLLNAAIVLRRFATAHTLRRLGGLVPSALVLALVLRVGGDVPVLAIPSAGVLYLFALVLFGVVTHEEVGGFIGGGSRRPRS